jgi:hypothetical protein
MKNIDHLKPFKAIQQEARMPNKDAAWQLLDCNGMDYVGEYVNIEDAVKTSQFDLIIVADSGVYKKRMVTKDLVFYSTDSGDMALFRVDGSLAGYLSEMLEGAFLEDFLTGNFLWIDDYALPEFRELLSDYDIDDVGEDKTFYTFMQGMTEHEEYKGVQVWASDQKVMKEARKKVDYLQITEGFKLRDFYKNEHGEVYAAGQGYNAYLPGEDYEESDFTIAQAMGFINKGGN